MFTTTTRVIVLQGVGSVREERVANPPPLSTTPSPNNPNRSSKKMNGLLGFAQQSIRSSIEDERIVGPLGRVGGGWRKWGGGKNEINGGKVGGCYKEHRERGAINRGAGEFVGWLRRAVAKQKRMLSPYPAEQVSLNIYVYIFKETFSYSQLR
nr:hypothetical protein [Morchella crassipes]